MTNMPESPPSGPISARRRERALLGALVLLAVLLHVRLILFYGSTVRGWDGRWYYLPLRSAVIDGDLSFESDLEKWQETSPGLSRQMEKGFEDQTGKYAIGWSIIALPGYLVVHGFWRGAEALGLAGPPTGFELAYQIGATAGHFLLGLSGILAAWKLTRQAFGLPGWASLAALTAALAGTPWLFYLTDGLYMTHAAGVALAGWLLLLLCRLRRGKALWWHWPMVGLLVGLLFVLRYSNLLLAMPALAVWASLLINPVGKRPWRGLLAVPVAVIPVAVQMLFWKATLGDFVAYSYGSEGFDFSSPAWHALISPRNGLLFYAPVLALAGVGAVAAPIAKRSWRSVEYLSWLTATGGLIYLNLCWWSWWFGQAFGARAYLELTPGAVLGMAWLLSRRAPAVRITSILLSCAGVLWTLGLYVLAYRDGLGRGPAGFGDVVGGSYHFHFLTVERMVECFVDSGRGRDAA